MNQTYVAVAGRIRAELAEIVRVVDRITCIWQRSLAGGDDAYVDAAALNLHGFYTGLERLFELIAGSIDQARPGGPHWHEELLREMAAEIPSVRPAVLSPRTRDQLDRYRGFRHVVRNVYTYNLDAEQINALVRQLPEVMEQVSLELRAFADLLEEIAAAD